MFVRSLLTIYNNIFKVYLIFSITQLAHKSANLKFVVVSQSIIIDLSGKNKTKQLFVDITAVFVLTVDIRRWYVVGVGRTDQYVCVSERKRESNTNLSL